MKINKNVHITFCAARRNSLISTFSNIRWKHMDYFFKMNSAIWFNLSNRRKLRIELIIRNQHKRKELINDQRMWPNTPKHNTQIIPFHNVRANIKCNNPIVGCPVYSPHVIVQYISHQHQFLSHMRHALFSSSGPSALEVQEPVIEWLLEKSYSNHRHV